MATPRLQQDSSPRTASDGVAVLVATGPSPAGRVSVQGELVWYPPSCGRKRCTCTEDFTGAMSDGLTEVARVARLDAPRSAVRRALSAAMRGDGLTAEQLRTEADRLLEIAARLPLDALVRRTPTGRVVALPPGSRPLPYGDEHLRQVEADR